ncbi:hypothetical protein F53441_8048 [Fusarium austroafricanum]|uniref:Uncharacterized protein n=1 Tax=Fusarium austroafricanum TaxID=2364996 RepID=A0A8H4KEW8_9HYPO|nr:hypothetical protein F53441_8048 [Fusarium austroafricanum]
MSGKLAPLPFYSNKHTLAHDEEEDFTQVMWGSSKPFSSSLLSAYFTWLALERGRESRINHPKYKLLNFHHVFEIRDIICNNGDKSQSDLQNAVNGQLSDLDMSTKVLKDSIVLVIRLLFMVRVELTSSGSHPSPFRLQMPPSQSFQDTMKGIQSEPPLKEWNILKKLPPWFNVIDLERKAGLRIDWTDYLNEHLTFQGGSLLLFRHTEARKYIEESDIL